MPLLNNGKPYVVPKVKSKKAAPIDPETACFVIRFTGEVFASKAEYDRKMDWYKAPMWTCRITGKCNLSLEECVKSEKSCTATLRKEFPSVFEKPVLTVVQNESVGLDALCARAAWKLQSQFFEDEPVELSIDGKMRPGKILSVSKPANAANLERDHCERFFRKPNDDKDKSEALRNGTDEGAHNGSMRKEDKLLPYRYSVKLDDDRMVDEIPAGDLRRSTKLPARDLIRTFIRSRALRRSGQSWTIDEEVARKFGLVVSARSGDFVADDSAVAEAYSIHRDRLALKAKRENGSAIVSISSEDEDDDLPLEALRNAPAKVSESPKSKNINGAAKRKSIATSTLKKREKDPAAKAKRRTIGDKSSSMKQQDLMAMLKGGLNSSLPQLAGVNLGEKLPVDGLSIKPDRNLNQTSDTDRPIEVPDDDTGDNHKPQPKKRTKTESSKTKGAKSSAKAKEKTKGKKKNDSSSKSPSKKDGMKQASLLKYADRGNASSPNKSAKSSPSKSKNGSPGKTPSKSNGSVVHLRAQPTVVRRLLEVWKKSDLTKAARAHLLAKCAKSLTDKQVDAIPYDEVRSLVSARRERYAEEDKLKNMNPEERKAYLSAKRKEKRAANVAALPTEENRVYEDLEVPDRLRTRFNDSSLHLLTFDTISELRVMCTKDTSSNQNAMPSSPTSASVNADTPANQTNGQSNSTGVANANGTTKGKKDESAVDDSSDEDEMTLAELKTRSPKSARLGGASLCPDSSAFDSVANNDALRLLRESPEKDAHFGAVAMCTEFMHSYWPVLVRVDADGVREDLEDAIGLSLSEVTAYRLINSLQDEVGQGALFVKVTMLLCRRLLLDDAYVECRELGIKLRDVAMTSFNIGEFLRALFGWLIARRKSREALRRRRVKKSNMTEENDEDEDDVLSEVESTTPDDVDDDAEFSDRAAMYQRLRDALTKSDLDQLSYTEKLDVLDCLLHRVMQLDAVNDHMGKLNEAVSAAWRRWNDLRRKRKADAEANKPAPKNTQDGKHSKDSANDSNKENATKNDTTQGQGQQDDGENAADLDMASKVKRRRLEAERSAAEKIERERQRAEESKRQKEDERYRESERDYHLAAEKYAKARHIVPLGSDRFHRRYWLFTKAATPGLYVEHGWALSDAAYSAFAEENAEELSTKLNLKEQKKALKFVTVPPLVNANCWFAITSVDSFRSLVGSLNERGARECELRKRLLAKQDLIEKSIEAFRVAVSENQNQAARGRKDESIKRMKKQTAEELKTDSKNVSKAAEDSELQPQVQNESAAVATAARYRSEFVERMLSIEYKLRVGGLGGVFGFDEWESRLQATSSQGLDAALRQLGACLLETFEQIAEKFRCGVLGPPPTGKLLSKTDVSSNDEDSAIERVKLISKYGEAQASWKRRVEQPSSYSQLHFLLSVMCACVKWDKSVADARCRICKRKGDDEQALLCDECNRAYHTYCLRPPLQFIPDGDWYCPSCAPTTRHHRDEASPTAGQSKKPGSKRKSEEADDFGLRRSIRVRSKIDYNETDSDWTQEKTKDTKDRKSVPSSTPTPAAASTAVAEPTIDADAVCAVCSAGKDVGTMLICYECLDVFHLDCHEPPLRYPPRGRWICTACRTGTKRKKSVDTRSSKGKRGRPSKNRSSDEDEDEEEEIDTRGRKRTTRQREPRQRNRANYRDRSESESGSESDKSRSQSRSKRSSKKRVALAESSEDEIKPGRKSNVKGGSKKENDSASALIDEAKKARCVQFIKDLNRHEASWPFRDPVRDEDAPDYKKVIGEPVDLKTIGEKLKANRYKKVDNLFADLSLMLRNCYEYNGLKNAYSKCADTLADVISKRARLHLGCNFSFDKDSVLSNGGTGTNAAGVGDSLNSSSNSNAS